MDGVAIPSRYAVLFVCSGLICLILLLSIQAIGPAWDRNREFLELNRLMANPSAAETFQLPAEYKPDVEQGRRTDKSLHRYVGHQLLLSGDREAAAQAFAAAGWDAHHFADMAEHFQDADRQRVIDWQALAVNAEPDNARFLAELGTTCQPDWSFDAVCGWFLEQNKGNRFVNPHFAATDLVGWQRAESSSDYTTGPCPGKDDVICAQIVVSEPTMNSLAGLGQCFQVEPGKTYRFSAWLKVETTPSALWRPLYSQGPVDGQIDGRWQGDEQGPTDWRFWERDFIAPAFEDGVGCFYPVRLKHAGQAWFYGAQVAPVTGE
ncbi:MAG TPA: hypothetical protein PKE20_05910 [Promineifilum sp.]|nr:hypothetical protein [Promineifilum sp.]